MVYLVLSRGPVLGEGFACVHLQGLLAVMDGLLKVLCLLAPDASVVGGSQAVLNPCPPFRKVLSCVDLGLLVMVESLLYVLRPLPPDAL